MEFEMFSKFNLLTLFFGVSALVCISCDGGSSSSSDVKQAYGEPTKNVVTRMRVKQSDGTYGYRLGRITGEQTINDVVYSTYQLTKIDVNGYPIAGSNAMDFYATPLPMDSNGKITIAGVDDHDGLDLTITPVVTLDPNSPVGVAQTVSTSVSGTAPGGVVITNATANGSYTLVSTGESVSTDMGVVPDCNHFNATVTIDGEGAPEIFKGKTLTGDLWHHPSMGIVKYSIPDLGIEGDIQGTWDVDDPTGEYRTIKMTGVVNSENPAFKLSTYDVSGVYDADKNTHAKMLVELRWADEETAKTGTMPSYPFVDLSFTTMIGIFSYDLIESPVSIFFPEENGKGFKYWYAYVNQAAKNEMGGNGICYVINVTADPSASPLRVTGRIHDRTTTE
jgi:hypothetical protein